MSEVWKVISALGGLSGITTLIGIMHNFVPKRLFYKTRTYKGTDSTTYVLMLWNPSYKDISLNDFSDDLQISSWTKASNKISYTVLKSNHKKLNDVFKIDDGALLLNTDIFPKRSGVVVLINSKYNLKFNMGSIDRTDSFAYPGFSRPFLISLALITSPIFILINKLMLVEMPVFAMLIIAVIVACPYLIALDFIEGWTQGKYKDLKTVFDGYTE